MKKVIVYSILILLGFHPGMAQKYSQVVGFNNGQNAIITINQGEIISDSFVLTINVEWTDKKGRPDVKSDYELLISTDNLQIYPVHSVRCIDLKEKDVYINKAGNLHFEILRNYTGQPISITINPVCVKRDSFKKTSVADFTIPEVLTLTYPGYLDKSLAQPIAETPDLIIKNERYIDQDNNNVINAFEEARLLFDIENIGAGIAKNVTIKTSLLSYIEGMMLPAEVEVGDIEPSGIKPVSVSVTTNKKLSTGTAEFKIEALEQRGFDAVPLHYKIETREFDEPVIRVVDAVFSTDRGGKVKRQETVNLRVLVQNIGLGKGDDISVSFILPNFDYVYSLEDNKHELGALEPGESRIIDFLLTTARRYAHDSVPIRVDLREKHGVYSKDTLVILDLQKELVASTEAMINPAYRPKAGKVTIASFSSDVDRSIPVNNIKHSGKFALVIGNEEYSKYQKTIESEANVDFAKNDARTFSKYLINTLGYKEENVYLLLDATKGEMEQKIDLITKRCLKSEGNTELMFYFAGHGLPHETTRIPYIIPTDVTGANIERGLKLPDIYKKLAESKADRIIVLLDACFSGSGRNDALLAARKVAIKPKSSLVPSDMIVITASSENQPSLPYDDQYHGMFTYYLLKALQESRGYMTYGELYDYIRKNVSWESLRINEKEQDPDIQAGDIVKEAWQKWEIIDESKK